MRHSIETRRAAGLAVLSAVLSALSLGAAVRPAKADCYDILGCSNRDRFAAHMDYLASASSGPTCDFLFMMRNAIYRDHGYCFRTARARAMFGGAGCRVDDVGALALNAAERANVAAIARAEAMKGCPR